MKLSEAAQRGWKNLHSLNCIMVVWHVSLLPIVVSAATLYQAKGTVPVVRTSPAEWLPARIRPLAMETRSRDELNENDIIHPLDGSRLDAWSISAQGGELITLDLAPVEFQGFLFVARADAPLDILDAEKGKAIGTPVALSYEFPTDGDYIVFVNTLNATGGGPYRIRARLEPVLALGGPPKRDGRFALIAGVGDYPGRGQDLEGPTVDAKLIRQLLTERFSFADKNIVSIVDKRVSRANLIRGIRDHLGRAGPEGTAVFYYSGHGLQLDENVASRGPEDPESDGVDEALYLADGQVLVDDEIFALTQALPAGRVIMIFDSCYSGGASRAASGYSLAKGLKLQQIPGFLRKSGMPWIVPHINAIVQSKDRGGDFLESGPRRTFIGASSEDQLSWTQPRWAKLDDQPASVFTYYFWNELSRSPSESLDVVLKRVAEQTQRTVRTIDDPAAARGQAPLAIGGGRSRLVSEVFGR